MPARSMALSILLTSRQRDEAVAITIGILNQGAGIYLSALLRPAIAPADVLWLSLAAGIAVHGAIEAVTTLKPDLRWPNDLLFGPRKFAGILTELNAEVTRIRHVVIGIGINVHQERFGGDLRHTATSLRIESGRDWSRQELVDRFVTIAAS